MTMHSLKNRTLQTIILRNSINNIVLPSLQGVISKTKVWPFLHQLGLAKCASPSLGRSTNSSLKDKVSSTMSEFAI